MKFKRDKNKQPDEEADIESSIVRGGFASMQLFSWTNR